MQSSEIVQGRTWKEPRGYQGVETSFFHIACLYISASLERAYTQYGSEANGFLSVDVLTI